MFSYSELALLCLKYIQLNGISLSVIFLHLNLELAFGSFTATMLSSFPLFGFYPMFSAQGFGASEADKLILNVL